MKKAIIIAIVSIVFLVLSNVYYYVDTFKNQVNVQKDILLKQSLIVGDQLNQYFKKTHTNISILVSETELRKLFRDKAESVEVQKRLELLFLSYSEHLISLKVKDVDGDVFELKKGLGNTFISSFSSDDVEEFITSQMYINPQGTKITYIQPLFNNTKVIGYMQFEMMLEAFFNSAFYNFNLEDFHFQWVMKPNGWVVYNTLHKNAFYPVLEGSAEYNKGNKWFHKIHTLHAGFEDVEVLTVFNRLEFSGNDYYLAFSMPMDVITSSIASNSFVLVAISLFVIILIIGVFSYSYKRHAEDERSLKKSEEALRQIIYYLPVGVVLLDSSKRIRQVNKAALKLFAFDDEDQLVGRKSSDEVLFENKKRLEKTTYSTQSNKYIFTNKDNEESVILHEQIVFYLLREEYSLQVFVEVSLLEKERKSEELANKAKSTFIANISHELRTPLNSMIGMTDIMMSSDLKQEDREMLNVVKRSADTLLLLINDILDFSKIEAGRFEIESIPFNMQNEVESCVNNFLPKAQARDLELTWTSSILLPSNYMGDLIRFRQVLNNLFSNAIKFTTIGKVHLSVKEVRGLNGSPAIAFTIKDTGIGIKQDKLNSIFKSFSQADESITRKYGGTGLGITISKELVNLMGGEIWAESPSGLSEDENYPGASFTFTLPFRTKGYTKDYNKSKITSFRQLRAFVITDDQIQVGTLVKNLTTLGIDYKLLSPSNDTIDVIRTDDTHHLMIVDHRPDFNGLEFLQEIYNHKLHKLMPVVIQSSDFEPSNTTVAKRLGADVYFRKPVNYQVLKDFIIKAFPNISNHAEIKEVRNLNVLVAEDNILNQRLARSLFKKIGQNIDVASNGVEALTKIRNKRYDIVFMDVMMPEMDGVAAMKQIKKETSECAIIAMTASVDEADKHIVLEAGMDDFIMKPTRLDDLSRMLDKWCNL
ncbi:response regulator [Carboxylicivirga linearis]|uniref:histidine kinase n=1 Tax=Carboxylicivirga linearis TaxID=1628157 RepID=A0ABS5JU28_9BACT|nr:response regulator [Carboxylicivirga linearis]MBS2098392.1 response regulator [Carboxylicivirga linearis]